MTDAKGDGGEPADPNQCEKLIARRLQYRLQSGRARTETSEVMRSEEESLGPHCFIDSKGRVIFECIIPKVHYVRRMA